VPSVRLVKAIQAALGLKPAMTMKPVKPAKQHAEAETAAL
jgi:hypothetical protein